MLKLNKIDDVLLELGGLPHVRDFRIHVHSFSWLSFSLEINFSPEKQTLGAGAILVT